ncbi:MAG: TlpA family protein disulfide reductase [Aggregatilineales bacterium]
MIYTPAVRQRTAANGRMGPLITLTVMVVPIFIIAGLGLGLIQASRTQVRSGPAPDFSLKPFDGGTFTLSEQRGQVVVINFWASWCVPCRDEAPELNAIWSEYRNRGVVMVGVDYLDNENDALAFLKEFNVQYLNGPDIGTKIADAYHIKGVPETYIVDKHGVLAMTIPLPTTASALRPILDELLAQP